MFTPEQAREIINKLTRDVKPILNPPQTFEDVTATLLEEGWTYDRDRNVYVAPASFKESFGLGRHELLVIEFSAEDIHKWLATWVKEE